MQLPVTAFPRWGMYVAIHIKLWNHMVSILLCEKTQKFIFTVSQTSEVLFIKQNCRHFLWLAAKQFLCKGWIASQNIHFLQTLFKSATTVSSCWSHAQQVETILNAHFQKICTERWSRSFMLSPKNILQGHVLSEPDSWNDLRCSYHCVFSQICKLPEFRRFLRYTQIISTVLLLLM